VLLCYEYLIETASHSTSLFKNSDVTGRTFAQSLERLALLVLMDLQINCSFSSGAKVHSFSTVSWQLHWAASGLTALSSVRVLAHDPLHVSTSTGDLQWWLR
jgi:hypothetical protein